MSATLHPGDSLLFEVVQTLIPRDTNPNVMNIELEFNGHDGLANTEEADIRIVA